MIGRAREGRVKPEDVEGATFTVSNLGAFDVDHFIAIINPPNAAILAVGSAAQVPVVVDGELTVGTRMKATISADHRVTDGAEAAQYMQTLKRILEETAAFAHLDKFTATITKSPLRRLNLRPRRRSLLS